MLPGSANASSRAAVDAAAVDVVAICYDVAEIKPDAEPNALFLGLAAFRSTICSLHLDGAAHRIDDAPKFHEHAVTGGLDDAAEVLPDFRVDEFAVVRFQPVECAFLVSSHQPRITRHVGGEDRCKPAHCGRGHSFAQPSAPVADAALDECPPLGHPVVWPLEIADTYHGGGC